MKHSQDSDTSVHPRRYYKREWTRNKPHLPKSISLPIFKLLPVNRPIFTCRQCGFINTLIPLCLWCCWTSDAAHREFEESMPRARRASTPARIIWKEDAVNHNPATAAAPSLSMLSDSSCSQIRGCPSTDHTVRHPTQKEDNNGPTSLSNVNASLNSNATVGVSSIDVANATAPPGLPPLRKKPRHSTCSDNTDRKGTLFSPDTTQPSPRLRHCVSNGVDLRRPMHLIKTVSTKSLRSAHIVIDLQDLHEPHDVLTSPKPTPIDTPSSPKSAPQTPKILRRKKGLSFYRASNSRPDSIASTHVSGEALTVDSVPPSASIEATLDSGTKQNAVLLNHARSQSQPANTVRLGLPGRPLYTAIRPNMSRPATPSVPPSPTCTPPKPRSLRPMSLPARAPSPGIMSVFSTSTAAVHDEEPASEVFNAYRPRSMTTHDRSTTRLPAFGSISRHRGGFSVSGETELRMALAREGGSDQMDTFKFKDMGKRSGKMMTKMRQLKEGLKGFVMRNRSS